MMKSISAWAGGLLVARANAAQPGASLPVPAPMRDLEWAQLNFLHTTDTHGWHGGHLQEGQYSADWGDYVSFAHHMRQKADRLGVDLLVVDTGDRVEGNGLYDASDPKGQYTYDIFKEQHVDIMCTGNHELYHVDTAARERDKTVPNFKDAYLASNLDYIDPDTGIAVPMAPRYKKFRTKNQNLTVVAFGFLFDFTGNANNTIVKPVSETVKEEWFRAAIREKPDIFVVVAHIGLRMEEARQIYTELRRENRFTPLAFFGGHAHVRDAVRWDARSFGIASGRYLETIGWMSIGGLATSAGEAEATAVSFHRRYVDNNLLGLYHHTGLNETTFHTGHGRRVSEAISKARSAMGLDRKLGCAPRDYWMARARYPGADSVFTWLDQQVLPDVIVNRSRRHVPTLAIINTGSIRFDIFRGPFTLDTTYIVSPFRSKMVYLPEVPYATAKKVLPLLNSASRIPGQGHPPLDPRRMGPPEQWHLAQDVTHPAQRPAGPARQYGGQRPLGGAGEEPDLVYGYTTRDDVGTDGDDAVHAPIRFYAQPNCIQAEVGLPSGGEAETVDLLFTDFITPWVMMALKLSGGDYSEDDVRLWDEASFTEMVAAWVKENWKGPC